MITKLKNNIKSAIMPSRVRYDTLNVTSEVPERKNILTRLVSIKPRLFRRVTAETDSINSVQDPLIGTEVPNSPPSPNQLSALTEVSNLFVHINLEDVAPQTPPRASSPFPNEVIIPNPNNQELSPLAKDDSFVTRASF